jgi:hypothetical protein
VGVRRVTILERQAFDFESSLGAGMTQVIPLPPDVEVGASGSGLLVVRVYDKEMGGPFRIDARISSPTCSDPARDFDGPIVATAVFSPATLVAPAVISCPIAELGEALSLSLSVTQTSPGGTLSFVISVELLLASGVGDDWTPLALGSKLRLWLDEHDLVAVGSGYSDWGDQSPGQHDFSQQTAGLRPATGVAINERPAPAFDGTDDVLTSASNVLSAFVSASAYHAFVVLRADAIAGTSGTSYVNDGVIADGGAGWWGTFLRTQNGLPEVLAFHWDGTDKFAIATGLVLGQDSLIESSFDGATIRCQVGPEPVGTISASNIASLTNAVFLGRSVGGITLDGCIASVIVCNQYLNSAERAAVRSYLSSRYGVGV